MLEGKLWIGDAWKTNGQVIEVRNKFNGEIVGTVPRADEALLDEAIAAAVKAAPVMAAMPAHERAMRLRRTAELIAEHDDEIALMIAAESGKALKFAMGEVQRAIDTFTIASEEARRIHGETVPLDAVESGVGRFGFYTRRPVGVVAAISPFNFPLNLVAHKVAPALAAGNSVVLKPASTTPLTAVLLSHALFDAGFPPGAFNLVCGRGKTLGEALAADARVAKVSFTGSAEVGRRLTQVAGIKKVTLELGNNSPVVIAEDADLATAAKKCALGAYYLNGQVCISVQRIYVPGKKNRERFTELFIKASEAMVVGDPLEKETDVGPLIEMGEADRVEEWVKEAVAGGAKVLSGGKREGAVMWPTVVENPAEDSKLIADEVFGPVASIVECDDFAEALELADKTHYGLQAGVFTRDIGNVMDAIKKLNFGGVMINETAAWRADHMPYGGNRGSGIGREGVRFAIDDMTNIQMVVINAEREG